MSNALTQVPLFAALDATTLEKVSRRCETRHFAKGDIVWSAGDDADHLLVVVTGQLEVWGSEGRALIGRVGPGECVGELGVLLGEGRTAAVKCGRATEALALDKGDFAELIVTNPAALSVLLATVSTRARSMATGRVPPSGPRVVLVATGPGVAGPSAVAADLAACAEAIGVGRAVVVAPDDEHDGSHRLVLVDLPRERYGERTKYAQRCDAVVDVVTDAELAYDGRDFALPDDEALRGRVIARLTRSLFGASVGVALGAGAAFGIAHVGVLAALEDEGVPVDVVAGTSFGAIIGAGLAGGLTPKEMTEIAGRIGNVRTALSAVDPSISGAGLLAGKRLVSIFSPFIQQRYFEELVMPMAAVTTDINTGERVALSTGEILPAMRASCAIPLVFTPSSIDGRVLVDGGLVDPVPVDVARELGADLVIGVNVVPQLHRSGPSSLSKAFRQINRFNPLALFSGTRDLPDLVDVMMSTMQTVYHELGSVGAVSADVSVNVDAAGYSWIDFHRALDLIDRGRAAGEGAAPKLKALVDARLRG